MPNHILSRIDQIERDNFRILVFLLPVFLFGARLTRGDVEDIDPLMAFSLAVTMSLLGLVSLILRERLGHRSAARWLLFFSYSFPIAVGLAAWDGFNDPRSTLGLIRTMCIALAIFGIKFIRPILASVFVCAALIAFTHSYIEPLRDAVSYHANAAPLWIASCAISIWLATRTVPLQQAALQTALSDAQRAQQAESRFLSNMSHEIRNPLNAIKGLIDQAAEEEDAELRAEQLRIARDSCTHLRSIVDDVLDLKKIEAGEFELHPASFDYQTHREMVQQMNAALVVNRHIDYHSKSDFTQLPRFLIGDQVRLTQLVTNLISNAVKFTPDGGAITTEATYDFDREVLSFEVIDSGIGMSAQTLSTLFTRFKQAADGTTKSHQGTGLGLAITKSIIDLMGGELTVQSTPGEGSTFRFSIPMPVDWDKETAWRAGALVEEDVKEAISLDGLRILCVDDSNINLKVVSRPLSKAGASVTTALSGKEALELIRVHEFDMVLTDISMPEMDGEQLQQELKAWKLNLPVVAITGNVLQEDVKRYLANGFVAALGKPLDIEQLLTVVRDNVKAAS